MHPSDEWYVGGDEISLCHKQPTNMRQRFQIIKNFKDYCNDLTVPILVDLMDNNFQAGYDAVPERIFVIENNKTFSYVGGPGPFEFFPEQVKEYLDNRYNQQQQQQHTEDVTQQVKQ
ncbi:thyroxine 5'-deiodinase [Cavenderia fasciculata]|uniref:Thyroxine 5'-deiodinase n=1 Tax=Cavenderia fasciculata TaxID=261658 RepID=F4Q7W1_CACFS|nr:thyroxine 5'-deiodinase [Cavenderia fasciculata]EGG15861.1 thyroxine 5'-deiodinase [Cavenderia fasciculata]|eukprot:XP_004352186.1 thyroxine 5'-deiodinase [Cavenderia fasciculata]